MAKQQGETKAPLVITLAFFVLLSLGLGVFAYMENDAKNTARAEAKKASDDKSAAERLRSQDQEQKILLKTALGINTQEDLEILKNMRNEAEVRKQYVEMMTEIRNKLQGTPQSPGLIAKESQAFAGLNVQFNVTPDDVVQWPWPEGAKIEGEPRRSILGAVVASHARGQLATAKAATAIAAAKAEEASYKQAKDAAEQEKQKFIAAAAEYPKAAAALRADADSRVAKETQSYKDVTKDYIEDRRQYVVNVTNKDIKIAELEKLVASLREQLNRAEEELEEIDDPFPFDKPHGSIITRRGNIVTISVGSADHVRPGLTFRVRPADAQTPGAQTRMVPKLDRNGRPKFRQGKPVMEVPAKGSIEVIQVLGPSQSLARITDNPDPIRESILAGDLIYNSSWRKEGADRVALFGVFDVDADGIDDIRQVTRDLQKMGIAVDAYFDLEQKKWVDPATGKPTQLTPLTNYAVEGYYPAQTGGEGIAGARSAIDQALRDARAHAREKGAKVVRMRDFFPRIGYKINLDISPDTVNRAYSRYLVTLPSGDGGEQPPPMPPKN
jgi:hypothetical protein